MGICFCGVLIVAYSKSGAAGPNSDPTMQIVGIILGFISAWFYASTCVMNRALKDVHFSIIGFYHPLTGLVVSLSNALLWTIINGSYFQQRATMVYVYCFCGALIDLFGMNILNIAF